MWAVVAVIIGGHQTIVGGVDRDSKLLGFSHVLNVVPVTILKADDFPAGRHADANRSIHGFHFVKLGGELRQKLGLHGRVLL